MRQETAGLGLALLVIHSIFRRCHVILDNEFNACLIIVYHSNLLLALEMELALQAKQSERWLRQNQQQPTRNHTTPATSQHLLIHSYRLLACVAVPLLILLPLL